MLAFAKGLRDSTRRFTAQAKTALLALSQVLLTVEAERSPVTNSSSHVCACSGVIAVAFGNRRASARNTVRQLSIEDCAGFRASTQASKIFSGLTATCWSGRVNAGNEFGSSSGE